MTVKIEFRDMGQIVRFEGNALLWDGVNVGDEAAQPGEIIDTVEVKEHGSDFQPWHFEVPVNEVVEPNTSYTSRLALDFSPPDGQYQVELWLQQGAHQVTGWMLFSVVAGHPGYPRS
jgi:hypothetical protein